MAAKERQDGGMVPGERWAIEHTTRYRYDGPVTESVNEARLRPLDRPGRQHPESFELVLEPAGRRHEYRDFYGNAVQYFEVAEPHRELAVTMRATVAVAEPEAPAGPGDLADLSTHPFTEWMDFVGPSPLTSLSPALWRLGVDAVGEARGVVPEAGELLRWVHATLRYEAERTTVTTGAEEVLALGRGVCQDFAHVFLSLCRTRRIPARYVSGYVGPGPGREQGEGAMHAWAEVLVPGWGWWGLDPTAGRPVGAAHVAVAVGRDYGDVKPIAGTYRGGSRREMEVAVILTRLGGVGQSGKG